MHKRKFVFFIIMIMFPILSLEITLQLYYRISNGRFLHERMALPIFKHDDTRYYKLKSNLSYKHRTNEYDVVYYTNSQGLRSDHRQEDISINKNDNIFRILFLGPSFTFGWANDFEDIYSTIISKNIFIEGKTVQIMNLGTPAQPMGYQLCWLEKEGYRYNPDMVVQTVYGNPEDIVSLCQKPEDPPFVKNGYLCRSQPSLKQKLVSRAKNIAIVFYGWYIYQSIVPESQEPVGLGTELYENNNNATIEENSKNIVEKYRNYMDFVRTTLNKNIPVVFLHIPFSYTVRPNDVSRWKHKGFMNPYELRKKAKEINKSLEQNNIPFINPTDELIEKDKETRMYYFLDIHFTPIGNKVVSKKAISYINKLLSIPVFGTERSGSDRRAIHDQ